ncbi:hypothetical protein [Streptomyces massasporeus]|uniref:hypothetical protein n=1 Tax=Streptomyces massasporeus TaxID=67324 RepID=UPI0033ABF2A6
MVLCLLPHVAAAPRSASAAVEGGSWFSYDDGVTGMSASGLDIDQMGPWPSGASVWSAQRREAYANDQGQEASRVAVTARSNRSRADQDPAQWLPPAADVRCLYMGEWVATKLRWNLTADEPERVLTALEDSDGAGVVGPRC